MILSRRQLVKGEKQVYQNGNNVVTLRFNHASQLLFVEGNINSRRIFDVARTVRDAQVIFKSNKKAAR